MAGPFEVGMAVVIEQTITIGNIIEILVIGGGGISVFATMRSTVKQIRTEVAGMQIEIKKLGEILIAQADIRGEMKVLGTRITNAEQDIRELRHGEGLIVPRTT